MFIFRMNHNTLPLPFLYNLISADVCYCVCVHVFNCLCLKVCLRLHKASLMIILLHPICNLLNLFILLKRLSNFVYTIIKCSCLIAVIYLNGQLFSS